MDELIRNFSNLLGQPQIFFNEPVSRTSTTRTILSPDHLEFLLGVRDRLAFYSWTEYGANPLHLHTVHSSGNTVHTFIPSKKGALGL